MTAHFNWRRQLPSETAAEKLELFYAHLTLSRSEDESRLIETLVRELPLDPATRQHLRSLDPARLLLYRQLTRATHRRVLSGAFPRAIARLGDTFDVLFEEFLDATGTNSHFLRALTPSFLSFCEQSARNVPTYIWELARLEALRIEVAAAPDSSSALELDLDLERGLVFSEAVRLLSLSHAVHQLPEDEDDRTEPQQRPTHLLSYRSPDNQVVYLELSALAAAVVRNLMNDQPLGASIQNACSALGEELSETVLAGTAQVLSDLAARRAIIGVR